MRVLLATTAGTGHFGPMLPVARACVEAGHEVLVAAPASFAEEVARAGLRHAPFADVDPAVMGAVMGRVPSLSREEANRVVLTEVFGRLDARAAFPGVAATIADWRPDVVVREPAELGSLVAAAAAEVPLAQVCIGMSHAEAFMSSYFAGPLGDLASDAGVDPEHAVGLLTGTQRLTSVPAVLDDALPAQERLDGVAVGAPVFRFRAPLPPAKGGLPPAWGDDRCPLVYVTFGSVTARAGPFGAVYPAALAALAGAPVRVLMTTGAGLDQETLGPVPDNAHVEAWWPQADVLPHAAVVVGHGGFGTTMAALAAGVPQVVLPLFAHDQFVNAAHVAAVGAGVHHPCEPGAADGLADAVADVLGDLAHRERARAVAAEIDRQPPAAACVTVLEELAGT